MRTLIRGTILNFIIQTMKLPAIPNVKKPKANIFPEF